MEEKEEREMEREEVSFLIKRAQKAHAVEACLVFGEMAAELGDRGEVVRPVIQLGSVLCCFEIRHSEERIYITTVQILSTLLFLILRIS